MKRDSVRVIFIAVSFYQRYEKFYLETSNILYLEYFQINPLIKKAKLPTTQVFTFLLVGFYQLNKFPPVPFV